jgi:hypothetical protein
VNVICSVGHPSKRLIFPINVEETPVVLTPVPVESPKAMCNDDVIVIESPHLSEMHLPPKKKAICSWNPAKPEKTSEKPARPKYNPMTHYRKMLGLHNDEPHEDEIVTVEEHDHEDTTAKYSNLVHWRKRTSQKFSSRFW